MKKYRIDYTQGSGSGCDELFNTKQDAEFHMSFWTEKEKKGCVIVEVEVETPIMRPAYKKQVLKENYNMGNKEQTFKEWVEIESQNDPDFFRWLFEIDAIGDFECPNNNAFEDFLKLLED